MVVEVASIGGGICNSAKPWMHGSSGSAGAVWAGKGRI